MTLGPKQLQWIEALESGQYKQGVNYLCRLDGGEPMYCCLGVGCEIFKIPSEEGILWNHPCVLYGHSREGETSTDFAREIGLFDSNGSAVIHIPEEQREFFDFVAELRPDKVIAGPLNVMLTNLNDSRFTFKQIAQILRKFPQYYFSESV